MDFIGSLFTGSGVASTLVFLCLSAIFGVLLGKLKIFGIKLGIAGVLFSGILITHLGAQPDLHLLHFIKEFGLILFVYSIGIELGPRFFSSFKKDGLQLNILAASIVLGGFLIAFIIFKVTDLSPAVITGIMCGAVTNTPSLGAAQQILTEQGGALAESASQTGMAYAVAYPFGIIGIILTMLLVRFIFRINISKEEQAYKESIGASAHKLQRVEIKLMNANLYGKEISYIKRLVHKEFAFSRILRNNEYLIAEENLQLKEGDVILGVTEEEHIPKLQLELGDVEIVEKKEITGILSLCNVLVTNRDVAGKTIEQIGIYRRYPANVTRIYRSGEELLPTSDMQIELGDTLRIVGKKEYFKEIKNEFGNSIKQLSKANVLPLFIGIVLGIILGSIPIFIPGVPAPAKLGLAGGPLVIAILLGYKGRFGKMDFYMTPGANMMIRELGIILFLACVGLSAGGKFVETILNGGLDWMFYGILITLVPILTVAIIGRFLKINYLKICGTISGSMTDPPALEFANSISPIQAQSTAYATVYPLTMFLRILLAQVLIMITL